MAINIRIVDFTLERVLIMFISYLTYYTGHEHTSLYIYLFYLYFIISLTVLL